MPLPHTAEFTDGAGLIPEDVRASTSSGGDAARASSSMGSRDGAAATAEAAGLTADPRRSSQAGSHGGGSRGSGGSGSNISDRCIYVENLIGCAVRFQDSGPLQVFRTQTWSLKELLMCMHKIHAFAGMQDDAIDAVACTRSFIRAGPRRSMGSAGSGSGSGSIAAARSHAASSVLHAASFSRQRDARMVPSSSIAGSLHEWLPGSAGGGAHLIDITLSIHSWYDRIASMQTARATARLC